MRPKTLFIFEFGFPPYREFILSWYRENVGDFDAVCGSDRFVGSGDVNVQTLVRLFGWRENILFWLSPFQLFGRSTIITTFNLRRPHTWIWIFIFPKKRWVLWGQGKWRASNWLSSIIRNAVFRRSHGYIVYTEEGKENLIKNGYPQHKISVAFNTLSIPNAGMTFGEKYFIYLGRIQERKMLHSILPYLKGNGIRLRIVGDGAFKPQLKNIVRELDCWENVDIFDGTYDEQEIRNHFSGAIGYISPGHVGLGVVHAFAYGVPVCTCVGMDHAPEFAYCSNENSYLADGVEELVAMISRIEPDSEAHLKRKRIALQRYILELSEENVFHAFKAQLGWATSLNS